MRLQTGTLRLGYREWVEHQRDAKAGAMVPPTPIKRQNIFSACEEKIFGSGETGILDRRTFALPGSASGIGRYEYVRCRAVHPAAIP